jgi:hypothetical protein
MATDACHSRERAGSAALRNDFEWTYPWICARRAEEPPEAFPHSHDLNRASMHFSKCLRA